MPGCNYHGDDLDIPDAAIISDFADAAVELQAAQIELA